MRHHQDTLPLTRDEAVRLLQRPEEWEALPEMKIVALLYFSCLDYGLGGASAEIPTLRRLYAVIAGRLTTEQRLALLDAAGTFIAARPDAYRALFPFAFVDPDRRVTDTARGYLAALIVPDLE